MIRELRYKLKEIKDAEDANDQLVYVKCKYDLENLLKSYHPYVYDDPSGIPWVCVLEDFKADILEIFFRYYNPNFTEGGSTLLHLSIFLNDDEKIKVLLKCGAKNLKDQKGFSPFNIAISNNNKKILNLFLKHFTHEELFG